MNRFEDKIVVITGGSDGIGLASAKAFAAEGAVVYVTGRRADRLDAAVHEIGGKTVGVQGDVANGADLDRLYERIARDHGRVDIVFANAGFSEAVPLGSIDDAHFDRVFGANVKGLIFTVQKALPLMKSGASVILNSSGTGSKGFSGLSIYGATKAAIRSLARTWTAELARRGIRVNVVAPGMIETPAMDGFLEKHAGAGDLFKRMIPFARLGEADEVAKAVLFLASPESSFIGGVELPIDGGLLAV